jgi:hypothetical protein
VSERVLYITRSCLAADGMLAVLMNLLMLPKLCVCVCCMSFVIFIDAR